jgi:hypothetical protein
MHNIDLVDGYGGLEHRASTALMCARGDLPVRGSSDTSAESSEGYRGFLGGNRGAGLAGEPLCQRIATNNGARRRR